MKFGGIFRAIKKAFRRTGELQTKNHLMVELPSETSVEGDFSDTNRKIAAYDSSSFLDTQKTESFSIASEHAIEKNSFLVDLALINRVKAHGINLNKIDIAMLQISTVVANTLKRSNITTVGKLCECNKQDLLRIRVIGIKRLTEIGKGLNAFLIGLLPGTERLLATQLTFDLDEKSKLSEQDLYQQMCETVARLYELFHAKVPISFLRQIPGLWDDLISSLGKEPDSFVELREIIQTLKNDSDRGIANIVQDRLFSMEKTFQMFNRAIEYESVDNELDKVVCRLKERELLILRSRYRPIDNLTLDSIGKQLGITRERVRQIQEKARKKLSSRTKRLPLLFSHAALNVSKSGKENLTLEVWTNRLVDLGFIKNPRYIELLVVVAKSTNIFELRFANEITESSKSYVPHHLVVLAKTLIPRANKLGRNCGVVRTLALVDGKITAEDVQQILQLNSYREITPGWWIRDLDINIPERIASKVITHCGPVSVHTMRYALKKHLSRYGLPPPPSEVLAIILQQKGNFRIENKIILMNDSTPKPTLTGPELLFLDALRSEGPVLTYETIHRKVVDGGFSPASVTSLLKYSPLVYKISTAMYSLLGAKYTEMDVMHAQSKQIRTSANPTMRVRSDGMIDFEINAGAWLEYGGIIASDLAAPLKGKWKLINGNKVDRLIVNGSFIRGLSKIYKNLGLVTGDRIRIEFNTWTREAKMIKAVRDG